MKTIKAYIWCSKKQAETLMIEKNLTLKHGQFYSISEYLHVENTIVPLREISQDNLETKFHNPTFNNNKIWFDVEVEVLNSYFNDCCRNIRRLAKFVDKETIYKHDTKRTIDALNSLL